MCETLTLMKIGLHLPQAGPRSSARAAIATARSVEELGFDSVWLFDHLIAPTHVKSRYPATSDGAYAFKPEFPYLEATALLGALAAATTRVRMGTRVLVSILRPPVLLAKQLASIDAISGGRLVLGAGIGWMQEEFAAVGVPMERRLARLDEHVAVMSGAWRGIASFRGEFYEHVEAGFYPRPCRPSGRIPVLLGGNGDALLRRVARYADGWAVHSPPGTSVGRQHDLMPTELLDERLATLRRFCDEAGRDFDELEIVSGGRLSSNPADLEAHARLGVSTCALVSFAPPDQIVERAARLAEVVGTEIA